MKKTNCSDIKNIKSCEDPEIIKAFEKAFKESGERIRQYKKQHEKEKEWLAKQDWRF